ncbi:MAG: malonic semialdehyde reductase [Bifidobacteriales bacterium]|uniref:malonic semialdehyde reductase n=1 Tax=Bombella sp. ESL0385 TaxID=2676446 RepID=UPI0012D99BE4|nr:malonic semialdehyde reductase [Bombella sp. ESL0385]MCT6837239.1 malonic semialdehyde reductase [Bifidobacteriales bacterium]MCT6855688.1 malonic semialdehyde reductase [Bombella apis]MUG90868.1 malonic semialdehyde reductase [Bombella sp. ESL0385]
MTTSPPSGVTPDGQQVEQPKSPLLAEELFTHCRTAEGFSTKAVGDDVLHQLYDLLKLGPTSGNCSPARFAFLQTQEARGAIRPALSLGNVERAMAAPVLVVVGYDPLFFEQLKTLNPLPGLRDWFAADVGLSDETAFRNGTLQGAYLIMAARALGLAVRPMSGFDAMMVEEQCFRKKGWRANFLVALGYPDEAMEPPPRAPRLPMDEACLWL